MSQILRKEIIDMLGEKGWIHDEKYESVYENIQDHIIYSILLFTDSGELIRLGFWDRTDEKIGVMAINTSTQEIVIKEDVSSFGTGYRNWLKAADHYINEVS